MDSQLHLAAGSAADGPYRLAITPEQAGWAYSGLRVLDLAPGGPHELRTGGDEMLVLPLAGSAVVDCDGERFELAGRPSVFAGVTDFAYLPPGSVAQIRSANGGQPADPRLPVGGPASRGQASRGQA
jgi:5-deoxy-glucuronate isomerase